MQNRYIIQEGSNSGHCCFSYTVVDTAKPCLRYGGTQYLTTKGDPEYDSVCECFDVEDAELICAALNALCTFNLSFNSGD